MAGLDQINKTHTQVSNKKSGHTKVGNHSAIVLVLKGLLDQTGLTQTLTTILSNSDFLKGRTRRAWHLAPYWVPQPENYNSEDLRFFNIASNDQKNIDAIIQQCACTPFKDDQTLLGFDLIHCKQLSYVIMRFDHKVFDGRGAEAFLEYILNEADQGRKYHLPSQGPQLHSWKSLFLSGQCINRFLRSMVTPKQKVARLNKSFEPDNCHRFYQITFSEDQTDAIDNNALNKAGYLMNGIFFLSCVAKGFDSLLKEQKVSGNILIPINVDMRETKFSQAKVFFNHLSFMLFNVRSGLEPTEYIELLKKQFIDQTKNKILTHFIKATLLMRIVPIKLLAYFMNSRMKKAPFSFSFSYIGNQAFNLTHVKGIEVVNLFHIPIVPVNPGVGIFFTRFNKKLNMIISGFNNSLSAADGQTLKENIITGLNSGKI